MKTVFGRDGYTCADNIGISAAIGGVKGERRYSYWMCTLGQ